MKKAILGQGRERFKLSRLTYLRLSLLLLDHSNESPLTNSRFLFLIKNGYLPSWKS